MLSEGDSLEFPRKENTSLLHQQRQHLFCFRMHQGKMQGMVMWPAFSCVPLLKSSHHPALPPFICFMPHCFSSPILCILFFLIRGLIYLYLQWQKISVSVLFDPQQLTLLPCACIARNNQIWWNKVFFHRCLYWIVFLQQCAVTSGIPGFKAFAKDHEKLHGGNGGLNASAKQITLQCGPCFSDLDIHALRAQNSSFTWQVSSGTAWGE